MSVRDNLTRTRQSCLCLLASDTDSPLSLCSFTCTPGPRTHRHTARLQGACTCPALRMQPNTSNYYVYQTLQCFGRCHELLRSFTARAALHPPRVEVDMHVAGREELLSRLGHPVRGNQNLFARAPPHQRPGGAGEGCRCHSPAATPFQSIMSHLTPISPCAREHDRGGMRDARTRYRSPVVWWYTGTGPGGTASLSPKDVRHRTSDKARDDGPARRTTPVSFKSKSFVTVTVNTAIR